MRLQMSQTQPLIVYNTRARSDKQQSRIDSESVKYKERLLSKSQNFDHIFVELGFCLRVKLVSFVR